MHITASRSKTHVPFTLLQLYLNVQFISLVVWSLKANYFLVTSDLPKRLTNLFGDVRPMRIFLFGLFLGFISVSGVTQVSAQDAGASFCSQRSESKITDLTVSERVRKRQNSVLELFKPPQGEGYVSPERIEKGFDALEEFRRYCIEQCNAYETLSMYIHIGQINFELQRYGEAFAAYQQAINTGVRVPSSFETDMLRNSANIYFERGEYQLLTPCLNRMSQLATFSLYDDGHLMAASLMDSGQPEKAMEFINTVIKYREEAPLGFARSKDYRIKQKVLEKLGRKSDAALTTKLNAAVEHEKQPSIAFLSPPKMPGAVTKGKIQGTCTIEFDVLETGKTDNIRIVECEHEVLQDVSLKAMQESTWRPRIIDGNPVKTPGMRRTYSFTQSGAVLR